MKDTLKLILLLILTTILVFGCQSQPADETKDLGAVTQEQDTTSVADTSPYPNAQMKSPAQPRIPGGKVTELPAAPEQTTPPVKDHMLDRAEPFLIESIGDSSYIVLPKIATWYTESIPFDTFVDGRILDEYATPSSDHPSSEVKESDLAPGSSFVTIEFEIAVQSDSSIFNNSHTTDSIRLANKTNLVQNDQYKAVAITSLDETIQLNNEAGRFYHFRQDKGAIGRLLLGFIVPTEAITQGDIVIVLQSLGEVFETKYYRLSDLLAEEPTA